MHSGFDCDAESVVWGCLFVDFVNKLPIISCTL